MSSYAGLPNYHVVSTLFVILFLFFAIFFGARGNTFAMEKANLQYAYQIDALEAQYQLTIRGRTLPILLTKVFYNRDSRYSMRYPSTWVSSPAQPGVWLVSGKEGTSAFYSNVNVQTLRTQKSGGKYTNAHDFIDRIKNSPSAQAANITIIKSGPIAHYLLDGTPIEGEYIIFTYSRQGIAYKQWQVAVNRGDGNIFYVWAYNAPLVRYQNDFTAAQEMLKSFNFF